MKILMLFTGGINSTYSLWRWLNETDHHIEARYITPSSNGPKAAERLEQELLDCNRVVSWLKQNVRDFNFDVFETDVEFSDEFVPLRLGFKNTMNVGVIQALIEGIGTLLDQVQPDGFVYGMSQENTAVDFHSARSENKHHIVREGVALYFGTARKLGVSWDPSTPADGDEWIKTHWSRIAEGLLGRFEQFEAIPTELAALISNKHKEVCRPEDGMLCRSCLYERVREERTDLTGKELDDIFAEYGSWGLWRDNADPATYVYRNYDQLKCLELLGYTNTDQGWSK